MMDKHTALASIEAILSHLRLARDHLEGFQDWEVEAVWDSLHDTVVKLHELRRDVEYYPPRLGSIARSEQGDAER